MLGPALPELLGGSADLTPSNNTQFKGARTITPADEHGDYIHYGVREFGMTAIMNGIALHGGFIPYGGTFLVFSDYARNAVRLACLMRARVILVYTHDSIGLGEDGPTHQPIEHLASLRAIPNMSCGARAMRWRPRWPGLGHRAHRADCAGPDPPGAPAAAAHGSSSWPTSRRGGYVLIDCKGAPECLVIATGSEVGIAAEAVTAANAAGRRVRLVSMPSTEAFDAQDAAYRERVLPPAVTRAWRSRPARRRLVALRRAGRPGARHRSFRRLRRAQRCYPISASRPIMSASKSANC